MTETRPAGAMPHGYHDPAERHRVLIADMERARRLRERSEALAAERSGADCAGPGRDLPDGDETAELAEARDRPQAAPAAVPGPRVPEPAPAPPPVTPASRCKRCGYLTTAAGHKVMCDE